MFSQTLLKQFAYSKKTIGIGFLPCDVQFSIWNKIKNNAQDDVAKTPAGRMQR
jgi:hypothetical protein